MKARASGDRSPLSAPDTQNLVSSAGSRAPVYEAGGRTFESCMRCHHRGAWQRGRAAACKAVSLRGHGGSLNARGALDAATPRAEGRAQRANPSAPTNIAGLAQMAERRPPKRNVRGSTPCSGASSSRRSQVVEGIWLQTRRRKPASVRIGPSSPGLVSSADQSSRLLPGGSAVRVGHEAPVHFPDSADGRAPGC